jgi:NADH-quinone oxidoreductase subunit D
VPVEFEAAVRDILKTFPKRIDQYEALLTRNPLMLDRTLGIGKLTGEECLNFGVTGPMLRASGVKWDLRKTQPYSGYEQYDFEVPTRTEGDVYARFLVRLEEMRQSLKIIGRRSINSRWARCARITTSSSRRRARRSASAWKR